VSVGVLRGEPGDDWPDRGQPALAWTGGQLFVFGGNPVPDDSEDVRTLEPLNDAALIDPETDDVDVLPDPPFERPLRTQPAAVAVGDDVLVVGQVCRETENEDRACDGGAYKAALYLGAERAWEPVELPSHLERISNGQAEPVGTTSDGRAVVILGARDGFGALANRELWTYSPEEDEWEQLPTPESFIEGACLADDAVVVGSGLLAETAGATGAGPTLQVMDLNAETRAWFPTAPAAVVPTGDTAAMTCGDDLVLVDDGTPVKQVFELGPGGGWRAAAEQPGDDVHTGHLWTGEEFLFLDPGSPTLAYDPEADSWRGIEGSAPTAGDSVWTGDLVIGWPGRTDLPVSFPVDDEG
jgi:hypothetical protein